jgi:inner membrane protein
MRSYTHLAGAILFYLIFAFLFNQTHLIVGIFFGSWASVTPDIIDRILKTHRGYGHSIFWLIPFIVVA